MISNIATSAWLIDFCHKAIWPWGLRSLSRNFMTDTKIWLRNTRGQSRYWWTIHSQDNLYLTCGRNLTALRGFLTRICLYLNWLLAVTSVIHEADDAYSIQSTCSCYWLDQFLTLALNTWILLKFFNISLDLSAIYFAHFSGCWASLCIVVTLS